MELRKTIRFKLPEIKDRRSGLSNITCSFDFDPNLNGTLTDLGAGGFGIEIHGLNGSQAETVKNLGTFMMTMYFEDESMMAGVKSVWHRVIFENGNMLIKCGVAIDVISPEDRLKLTAIIEKIRNGV
ncbi:MAG: hypothetical protein JXA07_10700 [Spirochaetes bacterium]|nr:hypothetical protein [Spirochaetota bacterium]